MNSRLDEQLADFKHTLPERLPPAVRAKLDETYNIIEQMELPSRKTHKERNRMKLLKKASIATTAAAVLGIAIIGTTYSSSPVMAEKLKQIPIVSSIFKHWGEQTRDAGIQQADEFATNVNQSVTQDGLTMNISSAIFDGTRIAMEIATPGNKIFSITNPEYGAMKRSTPPIFSKGSVESIEALYQDKPLSLSYSMGDDDLLLKVSNEVLGQGTGIGTGTTEIQKIRFPEQMNLTVHVKLVGYDKPFTFEVPLTQTTTNTVLASDEVKTYDHIHLKIDKLEMTPITTRLLINYHTDKTQSVEDMLAAIPAKYKGDDGTFMALQYEIADDQGNVLQVVGSTALQAETMVINYEPFQTKPKFVTIKPYQDIPTGESAGPNLVDENGNVTKQVAPFNRVYIPELAFTLQVK